MRILKPETVALATSNLLPPGVVFTNVDGTSGTTGTKMGFGAGGSVATGGSHRMGASEDTRTS